MFYNYNEIVMIKMINKKMLSAFTILCTVAVVVLFAGGCKKYADPPPYFEEDTSSGVNSQRKLLLIAIDGLVGTEVKTIDPPTIKQLLEKSKFSYKTKAEPVTTDAATWKTLISGVSYSKHKIKDSTFIYSAPAGSDPHDAQPPSYPSIFSRILTTPRASLSSVLISPWANMTNKLGGELLNNAMAVSNDQVVKDSAISVLTKRNADIIVLNFNGVSKAGITGAFSAGNATYRAAVTTIDGYIGEIMTALKARPNYNKTEEWLVVVTSTHGGLGNSYGGGTAAETDVLTLYYNENIKKQELTTSSFNSAALSGRDAATIKAEMADGDGRFNIGLGQQTIQLKFRQSTAAGSWPHFFSKMKQFVSDGWSFYTGSSGATWGFSIRGVGGTERRPETAVSGIVLNDKKWHTLTVVIYDSVVSGIQERWVKRFTDGIRNPDPLDRVRLRSGAIYQTITNTEPIRIGWGTDPGYAPPTFNVADIRIFNTALTDQEIVSNLCLQDITQHPKYTNLIGYWPCDDGYGMGFSNKGPQNQAYTFGLMGNYKWAGVEENPCVMPAPGPNDVTFLPKVVDVTRQLCYWLRIPVKETWNLDGSGWLELYDSEFVK